MTFKKSSRCGNATCVEVDTAPVEFIRSSVCSDTSCVEVACGGGSCVEVGHGRGAVLVRDSKNLDQAPLAFDHEEWRAFVEGAKRGEFDV